MIRNLLKTINIQFLILLIHVVSCFAQIKSVGVPTITNFKLNDYKAGDQNFAIEQDNNGLMYFGNHFGVLEFNGNTWRIVANPNNKTIIRSLAIDNKGTMWVGCQNEIGYLKTDNFGRKHFISLKSFIPEAYRNFEDVWKIVIHKNCVLFLSSKALYLWENNTMTIVKPQKEFHPCMFVNDERIFVFEKNIGLEELKGHTLVELPTSKLFKNADIRFVLPFTENRLLVGIFQTGLFIYDFKTLDKWNVPSSEFLVKNKINTAEQLQNNYYAIGTLFSGLLIIDKKGNTVQYINKSLGLQDNSVVSIMEDQNKNLWLALGNGIDYVEITSPFTKLNRNDELSSTVLNSLIYKQNLFVGTSQGLFYKPWIKNVDLFENYKKFNNYKDLNQNIWNLSEFDNLLYVGNQTGGYVIENNKFNIFSKYMGAWTFLPLKSNKKIMLEGYYNGLLLCEKINNNWVFQRTVKGFSESSRIISEDKNGIIWVAHGYKGVFKLTLNEKKDSVLQCKFYDVNKGFPTNLFLSCYNIRNEILFCTEKGVYAYNEKLDSMVLHKLYAAILGTSNHIRLLKEDTEGNIWFVMGNEQNDRTGYIHFMNNGKYEVIYTPFQILKGSHVPGFENISFNKNEIFFGTKNGITHYDKSIKKNYNSPFKVLIDNIYCFKMDSILYGTTNNTSNIYDSTLQNSRLELPYEYGGLKFSFSAAFYESPKETVYKFYLEGFDKDWSQWSITHTKEYTNLPEGDYTFRVKGQNIYQIESEEAIFKFKVQAPWQRTSLAYFFYFILFILTFYFIFRAHQYRLKIEKRKIQLEQARILDAEKSENIKMHLESENVLMKVTKDNLENILLSNTLYLVQKNEKLIEIRDSIKEYSKQLEGKEKNSIKKIVDNINSEIDSEINWNEFEPHFKKMHHDFLSRIKYEYPDLSQKDIQFCAYLRKKLVTKEIASLLNITVRGVEAGRLRLRKKFNLDKETDLNDFIINY